MAPSAKRSGRAPARVANGRVKCPDRSVVVASGAARRSARSNSNTCAPTAGSPDSSRTRPSRRGSADKETCKAIPMMQMMAVLMQMMAVLMMSSSVRSIVPVIQGEASTTGRRGSRYRGSARP